MESGCGARSGKGFGAARPGGGSTKTARVAPPSGYIRSLPASETDVAFGPSRRAPGKDLTMMTWFEFQLLAVIDQYFGTDNLRRLVTA